MHICIVFSSLSQMASRLELAKPDIVATFERELPHVMRASEFHAAFADHRNEWRLAVRTTLNAFEEFMTSRTPLHREEFECKRRVQGYVWGEVPLLEVLLGLIDGSYF